MLATILLYVACATDSPAATVIIKTPTKIEHGTILAPCPLTRDGNFDRLIKLMQKPISAAEVPLIPEAIKK